MFAPYHQLLKITFHLTGKRCQFNLSTYGDKSDTACKFILYLNVYAHFELCGSQKTFRDAVTGLTYKLHTEISQV